jgi:hypothetical protein
MTNYFQTISKKDVIYYAAKAIIKRKIHRLKFLSLNNNMLMGFESLLYLGIYLNIFSLLIIVLMRWVVLIFTLIY